jgi:D-ribose pyranase
MLKSGILNPHVLSLLGRFRHTNTLVIADRGFPSWPNLEIVDLSLVDGIPTVLQVLAAIRAAAVVGRIHMAEEFTRHNTDAIKQAFAQVCKDVPVVYEAHNQFKLRVPGAIGLIRTGDTVQYANMILESA